MARHLLRMGEEIIMAGIYTVVSGAAAEEKRLSFISNNLANALTAGYKSSRPVFEAVLSSSIIETDQAESTFVGTYDSHINFSEGSMNESGNRLDVALQGDGFFVIQTPQGDRYTRNGHFSLDPNGKLVTQDGNSVAGVSGEIIATGKQITIERDGSVFGDKVNVGKLKTVRFATREYLRPVGNSLFENVNPLDQELPAVNCTVNQGFYETSNVDVIKEMIDMIACSRAYEAYGKVQQAFGDMESKLQEAARV
jgi:flagellar basal-body rod protein FlgF